MHLLSRTPDGVLRLTEFPNKNNVPPYAILSHRWEADEPTFQDIALPSSRTTDPAGISKLHFCGKQAAKDGYSYFWVDTACIDKTNMVQLTEAINSMFRWYQQAEKCYVYMSDVDGLENFEKSAWFTRGWTLQELVAPHTVEFYCRKGRLLGTKRSLEEEIATVTNIPPSALRNADLEDFSIEERMGWAAQRVTTREEDRAYCLMGIFNVFMSAIYGEGDNAFDRLERKIAKRAVKSRVQSPAERKSTEARRDANKARQSARVFFSTLRATGGSPPPPSKEDLHTDDESRKSEEQQQHEHQRLQRLVDEHHQQQRLQHQLADEYNQQQQQQVDEYSPEDVPEIRPEDSISLYGQNIIEPQLPSSYLVGEVNHWLAETSQVQPSSAPIYPYTEGTVVEPSPALIRPYTEGSGIEPLPTPINPDTESNSIERFPLIYNMGYNCFGKVSLNGALSFGPRNKVKCKKCKFRYELDPEFAKIFDGFCVLEFGDKIQPVPLRLLLERFHHDGPSFFGSRKFRCFICKVRPPTVRVLYDLAELMQHLEQTHSHEQISNSRVGIYDV